MGEAAVFISDGAADFGRVFTLCVFKARADAKFAELVFARQRAEHARIFAFTFMVLRNHAFGIVGGFELQQIAAAPALIRRVGVAQHHALAALRFDFAQKPPRVGFVLHRRLREHGKIGVGMLGEMLLRLG